jgi:alanine racemase
MAPERALARIDLGAIERNCARLVERLEPGAALCAVVKADGYGHGALWAAEAAQSGGASWLAVVTAQEAADLRRHGVHVRVLAMGALAPDDIRPAVEAGAEVVAWTPEFLDALKEHAPAGAPIRVHVKYDTGMGRLGTKDPDLVRALCERADADERLELCGLMTHFATADEPGDDHFPAQLARFTPLATELKEQYPGLVVHAANSAATLREPAAHFDLVRCGIAIYGLDPMNQDPDDRGLDPALSLHSFVASVKRFEPGDSAGYGRRWKASEQTWVAVVPIGYGDGWRRGLTNNSDVLVRGRRYPLVGTVSMDNITIDLGPETDVSTGDPVVLLGTQEGERITAEEVAQRLDTINYEVTCGLAPRVRRLHEHL